MAVYSGLVPILELEVLEVRQIFGAGNGGLVGGGDFLVENAKPIYALEPRMTLHVAGAVVRVS